MQRVKAEFIANASHELKTPLTALSGYLEMLEDEEDERVRVEFLNDMRVQTTRLQSLARTLLDLSRLDANAVTFRTEEVDVEDLLHGLRRDFGYTGRSLNIRAEENAPLVRNDPTSYIVLSPSRGHARSIGREFDSELRLSREEGRSLSLSRQGRGSASTIEFPTSSTSLRAPARLAMAPASDSPSPMRYNISVEIQFKAPRAEAPSPSPPPGGRLPGTKESGLESLLSLAHALRVRVE